MGLGQLLFRVRGVIPVPFILAALIWADPNPIRFAAGALLALTAELLRLSAIRYAGGATRTREVGAPALVTSGPYAHLRNPLYLANLMIYLGYAFASGALLPYLPVIVLVYFSFQYSLIISLEERTLSGLFGEEYADYCRRAPRIWPKFSSSEASAAEPPYTLREALGGETRTLQGLLITWALLVARWVLF